MKKFLILSLVSLFSFCFISWKDSFSGSALGLQLKATCDKSLANIEDAINNDKDRETIKRYHPVFDTSNSRYPKYIGVYDIQEKVILKDANKNLNSKFYNIGPYFEKIREGKIKSIGYDNLNDVKKTTSSSNIKKYSTYFKGQIQHDNSFSCSFTYLPSSST